MKLSVLLTWTILLTSLRFLTPCHTLNTFLRYSGAKLFINLKYKIHQVLNAAVRLIRHARQHVQIDKEKPKIDEPVKKSDLLTCD
jgi:Holliday junction resolvase